jgi:xanthine dehydrogenase accessory factor
VRIGDHLDENEFIASIQPDDGSENYSILSPFNGILRGLIRPGMHVTKGLKIGDVDRRNDPAMCTLVSDKSLAIGGGVLEAVLAFYKTRKERR